MSVATLEIRNGPTIAYPLTIFYDGACRLCASEMLNFAARDTDGKLHLIDCSDAAFSDVGLPYARAELLTAITARDDTGRWIRGVDVFVAAYAAARLDWVSRFLDRPWVKPVAARLYPWVVRNRYRMSALGLHRIFNFFTHRADKVNRAHAERALSVNSECSLGTAACNSSNKRAVAEDDSGVAAGRRAGRIFTAVLCGPLIGGLPLIVSSPMVIPFVYMVGFVPALLGAAMAECWLLRSARTDGITLLCLGGVSGALACAGLVFGFILLGTGIAYPTLSELVGTTLLCGAYGAAVGAVVAPLAAWCFPVHTARRHV